MKSVLTELWRDRLDIVFPRGCLHCGGLVEGGHFRHLCTQCEKTLFVVKPPHCGTCGHPYFGETEINRSCLHCEELEPEFTEGKTAILLKGPGRSIIHALKYHHALHVTDDMVKIMRLAPGYVDFIQDAVLVPVPLHPRKLRERRYNQSKLLAECAVKAADGKARVEELLQRVVDTESQTFYDRKTRQKNLKNAFALAPDAAINPVQRYILVDDVFTTGSTLNACAAVLRRTGVKTLDALTFGHGWPSNMTHFAKPKLSSSRKKKNIPEGLWTKCPISGEIVFNKDLEQNLMVVPKSGYHFPIGSRQRITSMVDDGSFHEYDESVKSSDPLKFVDSAAYPDRIKKYEKESGLPEAVICGTGKINGIEVSLAVMDFRFCGGAMGAAVGEKITRAIERALKKKIPCIIVSASAGARMQEGIFSLMQMAKTSAALGRLADAKLPFISILTYPTTGGVSASFATLGDVIIAEPGALIGFAGARVIKETTKQTLPAGFQTAEFLFKHGLVDQIVSRLEMRERLTSLLQALYGHKYYARRVATAAPFHAEVAS